MRTTGLIYLALLLASPLRAQSLDARVQALMAEHDVPGLSLAVVTPDSTFFGSWGRADSAGSDGITPDMPFRIASVAKTFVAATAVIEAAMGTIGLDDDVSDLVAIDGSFEGPISLHDLLTHSAGFDERLIGYAASSSDDMIPLREYLEDRMPARGWPAGEQIGYSNHGFALAALAMEDAIAKSFADIARDDLFTPLDMHSTRFLTNGKRPPPGCASALSCEHYDCSVIPHVYSHPYPAGLAFSTARDMSRFISAIIAAEHEGSPLAGLIPIRFTHDERLPGMSYGFFHQVHGEQEFLSHAGSVPGFWALLLVSPEAEFGFFFAANGGDAGFGEPMRDLILAEYFEPELSSGASPPSRPQSEMVAIHEHASNRAGTYELTRYSHDTIERFPQRFNNAIELEADGDTLIVFAGRSARAYLPVANGLYESLDGEDQLAFGERRGKTRLFRSSMIYGSAMPAAYEKRSWYQAPGFLNEYVSWLLAVPILLLFVGWPIGMGVARVVRKRSSLTVPAAGPSSLPIWLTTAVTAVLFTVFGFGFVARSVRMFESGEILFGLPDALAALTWTPFVHAVFVGISVMLLATVVRRADWGIPKKLFYLVVCGFAVVQVLFLVNWNYLPLAW